MLTNNEESADARDARLVRVRAAKSPARYRILEALKREVDHRLTTRRLRQLSLRAARGSLARNLEILEDADLIVQDTVDGEPGWRLKEPRRPLTEWEESDITDRRTAADVNAQRRTVTRLRFDRIRAWEDTKAAARPGPSAPRIDLEINADGLLMLTGAEKVDLESRLNRVIADVSERSRERRRAGDVDDQHTIFLTVLGFPVDFEAEA